MKEININLEDIDKIQFDQDKLFELLIIAVLMDREKNADVYQKNNGNFDHGKCVVGISNHSRHESDQANDDINNKSNIVGHTDVIQKLQAERKKKCK